MLINESKLRAIIKSILLEETIGSKDALEAKYIKALENAIRKTFGETGYEIKVCENDQDDEENIKYDLKTENFLELKNFIISKKLKAYENVQVMPDTIESIFASNESKSDYKITILSLDKT